MCAKTRSNHGFRISLRQMLLAVAVVAVGCAALKYANQRWVTVIFSMTILAFMAAVIVALIDRGPSQAIAIGYSVSFLTYGTLFFGSGANKELRFEGRLPTTRAMVQLWELTAIGHWIDSKTGKVLLDYDPQTQQDHLGGGGGGFGGPAPKVRYETNPNLTNFISIGHCLWALLLGTLGGCFARFVYARRMAEERAA